MQQVQLNHTAGQRVWCKRMGLTQTRIMALDPLKAGDMGSQPAKSPITTKDSAACIHLRKFYYQCLEVIRQD